MTDIIELISDCRKRMESLGPFQFHTAFCTVLAIIAAANVMLSFSPEILRTIEADLLPMHRVMALTTTLVAITCSALLHRRRDGNIAHFLVYTAIMHVILAAIITAAAVIFRIQSGVTNHGDIYAASKSISTAGVYCIFALTSWITGACKKDDANAQQRT